MTEPGRAELISDIFRQCTLIADDQPRQQSRRFAAQRLRRVLLQR